jgi:hypothetical protein
MIQQAFTVEELFLEPHNGLVLPLQDIFTVHMVDHPGEVRIPNVLHPFQTATSSSEIVIPMMSIQFNSEITESALSLSQIKWEDELKRRARDVVSEFLVSNIFAASSAYPSIKSIFATGNLVSHGSLEWSTAREALSDTPSLPLYHAGSAICLTEDGYDVLEADGYEAPKSVYLAELLCLQSMRNMPVFKLNLKGKPGISPYNMILGNLRDYHVVFGKDVRVRMIKSPTSLVSELQVQIEVVGGMSDTMPLGVLE